MLKKLINCAREDSEPVNYSILRNNTLPLNGMYLRPVLKDVWELAADAEDPKDRYKREIARLTLQDLSQNADNIHTRKQAKEALRYAS
jgi:hypothetical protein